jgi:hypothetical protein
LLRIAAVIGFLFFIGHTSGAPWTLEDESGASSLVASMKAARVPELVPARTYWDFYFGFGVSISVYLFGLAAVLWQTASLSKRTFDAARPFMASLFVCYLGVGVVAARFFFLLPVLMATAVCLCIALAWWLGWRKHRVA